VSGREAPGARVRVNGREVEHVSGSLAALLVRHGLRVEEAGFAVALNGEVVRRSEWSSREIEPGDEIEIVGASQGG